MTKTSEGGPAVVFDGAVKTFGGVRAVAGVDLEIRRGEAVALLGRNGAGKSTTLSLLLGRLPAFGSYAVVSYRRASRTA